jgi:hypothetical protein
MTQHICACALRRSESSILALMIIFQVKINVATNQWFFDILQLEIKSFGFGT